MAHYGNSFDYIYDPPGTTDGLSIYEIAKCLGSDSRDLRTLCTNSGIKAMARNKPERRNTLEPLTDIGNNAVNDRRSLPAYSIQRLQGGTYYNIRSLTESSSSTAFRNSLLAYRKPEGGITSSPYRLLDFDGYWNGAPEYGMTCAARSTITFNMMAKAGAGFIPFYAFFKNVTSYLNNRPFSASLGIDHTATLVPTSPSRDLAACIGMEDIISEISGGATFFGIMLFSGTTLFRFIPCQYSIYDFAQRQTGSYQLPIYSASSDIISSTNHGSDQFEGVWNENRKVTTTRPVSPGNEEREIEVADTSLDGKKNPTSGEYTAVPVLKVGSNYVPMFRPTIGGYTYGAPFTINIGGQNLYEAQFMGAVDAIGSTTTKTTFNTNQVTSIFLWVRVWSVDYASQTDILAVDAFTNFKLNANISSHIVSTAEPYDVSKNDDLILDSSHSVSIPARVAGATHAAPPSSGFVDLYFALDVAFAQRTGYIKTPQTIDSSTTIDLTAVKLKYNGVPIGTSNGANQGTSRFVSIRFTT